jgi:hypothetical protein
MHALKQIKAGLLRGLRLLMPTCREALRLQSHALDGPLPASRRPGLWLHLLLCKWCRFYGRQIRFLRDAAHEHAEELTQAGSPTLSPAARGRIRQNIRAQQSPGTKPQDGSK